MQAKAACACVGDIEKVCLSHLLHCIATHTHTRIQQNTFRTRTRTRTRHAHMHTHNTTHDAVWLQISKSANVNRQAIKSKYIQAAEKWLPLAIKRKFKRVSRLCANKQASSGSLLLLSHPFLLPSSLFWLRSDGRCETKLKEECARPGRTCVVTAARAAGPEPGTPNRGCAY